MNRGSVMSRGLVALIMWLSPALAWAGDLMVDMLDVGQGDALLLTSPAGKRVLIDAGTSKSEVAAQLQRMGVTELAMVIASHPHADHIGGMNEVLEAIPVTTFVDNGMPHTTRTYATLMETVERQGLAYRGALAGQVYRLDDGITLSILAPGERKLSGTRSDLNSNSVVVRVDHGEDCFLFTGDSEDPSERALMRQEMKTCGVLKVAHHGSDHSTSTLFLNKVQPRVALISLGADNKYGHPGEETIRRLQKAGVDIYRTDHTGHVTLRSTGAGVEVVDGLPWWTAPAPTPEQRPTPEPTPEQSAAPEPTTAPGWSAGGGGAERTPPPAPPVEALPPRRRCLGP